MSILTNTGILNNPTWLLFAWNQLYISDTGNACVRKLSDIDNCFIGEWKKPGTEARNLISPTYMAIAWDQLYISDTYQNKIRKVQLTNTWNIIDVFWNWNFWKDLSGSFTGIMLSLPTWLAIQWNNLYVSDTWNNRILRLDLLSWIGKVFVWNGENKSIMVSSGSLNPDMIPISHPTDLKINNNKLYFTESINWVIKSISLAPPFEIINEFWTLDNIAYFGDFEDNLSNYWSYWFASFSWQIVDSSLHVGYSWKKSLRITWWNSLSGSFLYNFASNSSSIGKNIEASFYIKSISNSNFNITYWFTENNIFIPNNFKVWTINDKWEKFTIVSNVLSSDILNWFKIDVSWWSLLTGKEFLIDKIEINVNNINITWNISNKYENNFDYIWSIYIDWWNSYASSIFDWYNYKFSTQELSFIKKITLSMVSEMIIIVTYWMIISDKQK